MHVHLTLRQRHHLVHGKVTYIQINSYHLTGVIALSNDDDIIFLSQDN